MNHLDHDLHELRARLAQNERHLHEMQWALLSDGEKSKQPAAIDLTEIKLRAENNALLREIRKLEDGADGEGAPPHFHSPFA
jgi:hypothetical protein